VGLCRADKVLLGGGTALIGSAALFDASALSLGVPAAAFATVLADGIFRPSSGTFYPTISKGPRNRPRVALTFDDGPDPDVTPRALEVLARYQARATFFMIGKHLEKSTYIGAQVIAAGHEIGNHSWQHSYLQNFYTVKALLTDIDRTEALIRSLTGGSKASLYRAPVGLKSPGLARAAHARALEIIAWSVHSRDTIDSIPERIARRVLARIRPGDIVLMHDGHQNAERRRTSGLRALPLILQGLRDRGLEPVAVRELLES
jgi:peptidoglycan/xylan/chitin deacetylase (PgdA/CDA1 family)